MVRWRQALGAFGGAGVADERHQIAELAGSPGDGRAAQTLLPRTLDLGNPLGGGAVAAALWRRTAVSQCRPTATAVAGQPMMGFPRMNNFRGSYT